MSRRNRKEKAPERGEQMDMPEGAEMERTNVERTDRTMSAGADDDGMAGAEGIEDPTMDIGRQQGREGIMDDATSFTGRGAQKGGGPSREGTGYTGNSGNMSGSKEGQRES